MLFLNQASGATISCPWANLEEIIFTFVSTIQVWPWAPFSISTENDSRPGDSNAPSLSTAQWIRRKSWNWMKFGRSGSLDMGCHLRCHRSASGDIISEMSVSLKYERGAKSHLAMLLPPRSNVRSPSLPWKACGGKDERLLPARLISFRIFKSEKALSWIVWMFESLKLIFCRWFRPRELKMSLGRSFR